jgi:hypothetical protein
MLQHLLFREIRKGLFINKRRYIMKKISIDLLIMALFVLPSTLFSQEAAEKALATEPNMELRLEGVQNKAPGEKLFHRVMLINWADTLDNSAKAEVINLFLGLPDKIDGFESFELNDLSKSTESFEQVMILRFTSDESVKTYENHTDHLRIQEISPPLLSGFSLFEYWK